MTSIDDLFYIQSADNGPAYQTQPDDKAIKATVMNQSGNLHPSNFQSAA